MKKPLLITLLPSTGCDLGRWILAYYNQEYTERPHAPIFHILALKYWGATAQQYPLFITSDRKEKIPGIKKLIARFDPEMPPEKRLRPDPRNDPEQTKAIDEIIELVYHDLGDHVVNWSYWHFLKHKHVVWPSITTMVPWYEKLFNLVAFRITRFLMYKGLKLNQNIADQSLQAIFEGFDKLDEMLADGRRYLVGERLSHADLATAASLGPMILAQGYHGMLPNQARCPVFMQKTYQELRQRPTGIYIQRIYDQHRPPGLLSINTSR